MLLWWTAKGACGTVEDPSRYFDLNMLDIVVVPATFGKYRVVNKGIGVAVVHKTMLKP